MSVTVTLATAFSYLNEVIDCIKFINLDYMYVQSYTPGCIFCRYFKEFEKINTPIYIEVQIGLPLYAEILEEKTR